jgi:hypothetical protein
VAVHGRVRGIQPYTTQDARNHDTVVKHTTMTQDSRTHDTGHAAMTQDSRTVKTITRELTQQQTVAGRTGVVRTLAQRRYAGKTKGEITSHILSARPSTRDPC